jgi:GNAT superfamily N-acetyltransferase
MSAAIEGVRVEAVAAEAVRPLRRAVLRPHQTLAELAYPGDEDPAALHLAAVSRDGPIVGVATIAPEAHPRDPRPHDWRIRGMATAPAERTRGIGSALLARCLEHARERGAERVWCNARTGAVRFYAAAGFEAEGAEFEIAAIGPHRVMSVRLRDRRGARAGSGDR